MNIQDKLTKARIQLLLDKCFYGNLALHLKLEEDNSIPTFSTDGKHIHYNKKFAESLSDRDIQFILAHEILHNVLYHLTRVNNRNKEKWNLAIDFATNSILNQEFGYLPEGAFYNEKFTDMSSEQIYNKLPEMNGNGKKNGKYRRYENGEGEEKITIEIDGKGNVKVNGKKIKPFDSHKEVEGSKAEIDELEKDWKIQTVKSYEQAKMQGKNPAGMDIFIKELLQPKLDWRNMMKQFLVSISKSDYRWLPPNKKFIHRGMYMPSLSDESLGDVVVIIDNSGSTIQNQQEFFSECNGLLQQYDMNLHLIVCDMEINSYKEYHKGERIELKQKGGGGTDMVKAFDYIKTKFIQPTVVVCLTDGYTDFPKKEEYPTLWVLTKDSCDLEDIPFGQKVRIE